MFFKKFQSLNILTWNTQAFLYNDNAAVNPSEIKFFYFRKIHFLFITNIAGLAFVSSPQTLLFNLFSILLRWCRSWQWKQWLRRSRFRGQWWAAHYLFPAYFTLSIPKNRMENCTRRGPQNDTARFFKSFVHFQLQ